MNKLRINWPWELPRNISSSLCVVIDVNAAATNLAIILAKKVKKLVIVNESNLLTFKEKDKGVFVIGESKTLPRELFDASNLPPDYIKLNLHSKVVLYMSNNGSRLIEDLFQRNAKKIITASFVNIGKVVNYLKKINDSILLIPAGEAYFPDKIAKEDWYCAYVIKKLVNGEKIVLDDYLKKSENFVLSSYPWESKKLALEVLRIELLPNSFPLIPSCLLENNGTLVITKLL